MDVDWGLVVKLALPAKVTRRANKVIGISSISKILATFSFVILATSAVSRQASR
jgi:hypothetical protein